MITYNLTTTTASTATAAPSASTTTGLPQQLLHGLEKDHLAIVCDATYTRLEISANIN